MATTSPARIDDELYASAKLAGQVQSRSASQQVAHWARVGREIEASSSIAFKEIADVLAGARSYDSLTAKEQAIVRAEWSARMEALRGSLNLGKKFGAAGRSWVELDDDGRVVERGVVANEGQERTPAKASRGPAKAPQRGGRVEPTASRESRPAANPRTAINVRGTGRAKRTRA